MSPSLRVTPMSLRAANSFIDKHHRHHGSTRGHRFSVAVTLSGKIVGCAVVGRPVARMVDQALVSEVTRLCTLGHPNACSILYAACARACKAMGFIWIQTYILDSEPGTSLVAAGWTRTGSTAGGSWSRDGRTRADSHPLCRKAIWKKQLNPALELMEKEA